MASSIGAPKLFGLAGPYANLAAVGAPATLLTSVLRPGNTEPALMEASNLQTEEPTETARILGSTNNPLYMYGWRADNANQRMTYDSAAIVNSNITQWGKFRFCDELPTFVIKPPTSIISSSNAVGAVTDIDEGVDSAPDGNGIFPATLGVGHVLLGGFGVTGTPLTGNARAFFAVKVQHSGPGLAGEYLPLYADLFDNGTYVRSLGARAVTVTLDSYQMFVFTFDPDELSNPLMPDVQVRISWGDNGGTYAFIEAVDLFYETASGAIADSGWVDSPFDQGDASLHPTKSLHYFFDTEQASNVPFIYFLVLDDQAQALDTSGGSTGSLPHMPWSYNPNGVPETFITNFPIGYGEAGVLVFGVSLTIENGLSQGTISHSVTIEGNSGTTLGGQPYAEDSWRARNASGDFILTRDEKDQLTSYLDWSKGNTGAFYVALEPGLDLPAQLFTAFYARLDEGGEAVPMSAYQKRRNSIGDTAAVWHRTMKFKERL